MESSNLIDKWTNKVKNKLDEIPHRVKEPEEPKNKEDVDYKELYEQKKKEVKRLGNKLKRSKKDLGVSKKRVKRAEEKEQKIREERDVLVRRIEKSDKTVQYQEEIRLEVEKELKEVKRELVQYKETEAEQRKKGIHVADLQEDLSRTKEELSTLEDVYEEEQESKERYVKSLVRNIEGEKRAKRRKEGTIEEHLSTIKSLEKTIERLEEDKKEMVVKYDYMNGRINDLGSELNRVSTDKPGMVGMLLEGLSVDTYQDYSKLGLLTKKYKEVEEQYKRKEDYIGDELGYVIREGSEYYFISLEGSKAGVVVSKVDKEVEDGMVCKVSMYKGNKVVILDVYTSNNVAGKWYTQDKKERVRKVQRSSKKKVDLGEEFFREVHKYDSLIITAKNVNNYRDYFYRFGVIEVVDPYGEGDKKLNRKIDRADIVIVRTDAVPHRVTDYLKENCKDKTLFMYNTKSKDMAYALYNKAKGIGEEGN